MGRIRWNDLTADEQSALLRGAGSEADAEEYELYRREDGSATAIRRAYQIDSGRWVDVHRDLTLDTVHHEPLG